MVNASAGNNSASEIYPSFIKFPPLRGHYTAWYSAKGLINEVIAEEDFGAMNAGRSFELETRVISWRNSMPSRTSFFRRTFRLHRCLSNRTHCLYARSLSSFQPNYMRVLKEVLLIRCRTCVSPPRVYGFAGGRSLFQFDSSTLKRLAIARAMSSCTSKMSFSSRSYRSDQRW